MTTLKLTLSKAPFEVMVTGEKTVEYRRISAWMKSRLFDKKGHPRSYRYVEFVNGYGSDKPRFTCEFVSATILDSVAVTFSNGLQVQSTEPMYAIQLGTIVEQNNIK